MSTEVPMTAADRQRSIEGSRDRLRQSRAQIVASLQALQLRRLHHHPEDPFPRSGIMRAAFGHNGRMILGGAALTLALLRPGLIPVAVRFARFAPLVPVVRNLINRYVVRRNSVPD
jgi:hypothetical protein